MTEVRTSLYWHSVHCSHNCWAHLESRTYQRKKKKKQNFVSNEEMSGFNPSYDPG